MAHFLLRAGDFFLHRHRRLSVAVDIPVGPIAAVTLEGRPGRVVVESSCGLAEATPRRGLAFYSLTATPRAVGPRGRLAHFALIPEGRDSSARAEEPWMDLP